jgi:hypothetical protein
MAPLACLTFSTNTVTGYRMNDRRSRGVGFGAVFVGQKANGQMLMSDIGRYC